MISAILDTNVIVQASFCAPRSASFRAMAAWEEGRFRLILSPDAANELLDVLGHPDIRRRHGWSDDRILDFVLSLLAEAEVVYDFPHVSSRITRDLTDPKFLGLAERSRADYLVTNDRRHLLALKQYGATRIVTPARFLANLP